VKVEHILGSGNASNRDAKNDESKNLSKFNEKITLNYSFRLLILNLPRKLAKITLTLDLNLQLEP